MMPTALRSARPGALAQRCCLVTPRAVAGGKRRTRMAAAALFSISTRHRHAAAAAAVATDGLTSLLSDPSLLTPTTGAVQQHDGGADASSSSYGVGSGGHGGRYNRDAHYFDVVDPGASAASFEDGSAVIARVRRMVRRSIDRSFYLCLL